MSIRRKAFVVRATFRRSAEYRWPRIWRKPRGSENWTVYYEGMDTHLVEDVEREGRQQRQLRASPPERHTSALLQALPIATGNTSRVGDVAEWGIGKRHDIHVYSWGHTHILSFFAGLGMISISSTSLEVDGVGTAFASRSESHAVIVLGMRGEDE